MDEGELFKQGSSRMEYGNLERLEVVEVVEVGPGGHERVAQEGADRDLRVGMGPTTDPHLEEYPGCDERGRLSGGGVGDVVAAVSARLALPDAGRRAADALGGAEGPWPS
ncbi:MAG: hypothetical protein ACYCTI_00295 [Acidimicrobiales bacterium]